MPRGRHRHSPPLHRLLPPLTVAGSAAAVAAGAWFSPAGDHGVVLRALVGAAAVAACTGAFLLRRWDRAAGKRVAELTAARLRDEWRTDERIAELESDAEESREIRRRLEGQLRARRAELSRLRGEHAELLRRYATAESERARALESRRQLELAAGPRTALTSGPAGLDPAAFARAAEALRNLGRATGRHAAPAAKADQADQADQADDPAAHAHTSEAATPPALVPAVASAVLPYAGRRPAAPAGGFDYFGLRKSDPARDLADVVGDEAYAEHTAGRDADEAAVEAEDDQQVIDLTAHDETEQLDLRELRAHS
ncbi:MULTISPECIES: hypothetical protein [Streptomycetaceae]|uniref:Secreted protein n=1 Tax=Streptantibioticus cattleyicolor (strain ATCC 35852 / DSM 46488 / JCM 4925 / NBRC 14057 / NRRL 8057) TaxID=1003195 RepID=F8K2A1_STREN|nr:MULTISPECIES: hypothetical protein [Streptomycetaceae]AEW94992.1 hypothetical protein SCATT_26210 [Streptantibioticus cattleyicolor NRRL 8057 = DSM 46488]MYS59593.1 hypothetical protein [Streptomyces sp. SID5468]CCB75344.1 conserved exported protein of unknown function [Streptantibioticus cattleyicolor NRRL 8057 = DSM 46488]